LALDIAQNLMYLAGHEQNHLPIVSA